MPKRSPVAAVDGISDAVLTRLIEKIARTWNTLTNLDAYSVETFCQAHSISRTMFYELDRDGEAPDRMHVRGRELISKESAARWRASREQAARTHKRGSRKATEHAGVDATV